MADSLARGHITVRGRVWLAVLSAVVGISLPYLIGVVRTLPALVFGHAGDGSSISEFWALAVAAGEFFRVALPSMVSIMLAICVFVGAALLNVRRMHLPAWMISGAGVIAAAYLIAVEVIYPQTIAGGLVKFDDGFADTALQVSFAAVLGASLGVGVWVTVLRRPSVAS